MGGNLRLGADFTLVVHNYTLFPPPAVYQRLDRPGVLLQV